MEKLIVNVSTTEKRIAHIVEDSVERIEIERPGEQSLVGSIFNGIVTKVLPGMNAVFIDIGTEKNAYLHRDSLVSYVQTDEEHGAKELKSVSSFVRQGEKLLVQVEKDAAGTKGPKVTGIIEIPGENIVYMPNGRYVAVSRKIESEKKREQFRELGHELKTEQEGLIFRTSSEALNMQGLSDELTRLRESAKEILNKSLSIKKPGLIFQKDAFLEKIGVILKKMAVGEIVIDHLETMKALEKKYSKNENGLVFTYYNGKENIFAFSRVEQEIEKALKRIVWLDNGSYLIIEENETLTSIDVNTGKYSGKTNLRDTVLRTNLLATTEIARQIKLRDIAGIILIDFIDMKSEQDRESVSKKMEQELAKDERKTRVAGFTSLGILQLTRKRLSPSMAETMTIKCPVCEGVGRISSPETEAFRLERELWEYRDSDSEAVLIEASPEVREAFSGAGKIHLSRLEGVLGLKIFMIDKYYPTHFYKIKQFGSEAEIRIRAESERNY